LIEGALTLRRALELGVRPLRVVVADNRAGAVATELDSCANRGAEVLVAPAAVLEAVAGFNVHRGVLAVAARPKASRPEDLVGDAELLLVAEGLTDATNLGALIRNGVAFGVGGLLLDPTCADPLYRRSVRVSLANALSLPFARLDPWPASLRVVSAAGFELVALTPSGQRSLGQLAVGSRVALMVGSEGKGLSPEALAQADQRVRIPLWAGVDSLNVATAAAIALYHLRARDQLCSPAEPAGRWPPEGTG